MDDHVNSVKTVYDNWVNEFVDDWVDGNGAIGDVQDLMTRLGHGMITWEDCNTLNLIQYNETEDIIPPNIDEGKNQKAKESVHLEWSTVVDISIPPPSFKPVSLSLSRSPNSKTP